MVRACYQQSTHGPWPEHPMAIKGQDANNAMQELDALKRWAAGVMTTKYLNTHVRVHAFAHLR